MQTEVTAATTQGTEVTEAAATTEANASAVDAADSGIRAIGVAANS